ncbi:MAG: hypothetical protein N2Z67_09610 [Acetobacteraceae bacterium]|nr:hypothetical protein [Acetobacteraceae bacterium]
MSVVADPPAAVPRADRSAPPPPLGPGARGAIRSATAAFPAETGRELRAAPAEWRGRKDWLPAREAA